MQTQYPRYERYKDSGVSWLGEIPQDWGIKRNLGLFDERKDINFPDAELLSVTIEQGIIRQSEITTKKDSSNEDKGKYKRVQPDDLAYNKMRMWQGAIGRSDYEGIVSPAYIVIRPRNRVYSRYFHYLYRTDLFINEANRNSYGLCDDMNSLRYEHFKTIYSPMPPESTVSRIVAFLDTKVGEVEAAIKKKQRLIELLEEQKAILINNAVTKGLNPDAPMKDSGIDWIGEIPAHWEVKKVKHVSESQGRIGFKGYSTSDLVDEGQGALVLGASHMDWDGSIDIDRPVFISWKKYYESPEIMVRNGDVLIVQRGSTCGKVALVNKEYGHTTINPSLVLLKKISLSSEYFFLSIKVVLPGILNQISNTAIPMLSQFQIDNIKICIPPQNEQIKISVFLKEKLYVFDMAISLQKKEIQKLNEFKQTLIAHAVTGKIRI